MIPIKVFPPVQSWLQMAHVSRLLCIGKTQWPSGRVTIEYFAGVAVVTEFERALPGVSADALLTMKVENAKASLSRVAQSVEDRLMIIRERKRRKARRITAIEWIS